MRRGSWRSRSSSSRRVSRAPALLDLPAAAAAPAALPVRKAQGKQPARDVPAEGPAGRGGWGIRRQLRPAIGSRAPAPPRPKPTSVYNSVFMAAFTCCGGEWLILLPGIGCVHLPSTVDGFSHSLALPILIAAYLSTVLATHLSVALTLGRKWSSLSLSICISAVFMPLALRPPSPLIEVAIKVSRLHK
jgi:hypothetical protein